MSYAVVKNAAGTKFIVPNVVKNSAGSPFTVNDNVRNSAGTQFLVFSSEVPVDRVIVVNFRLFDNRIFKL